MVGRRVASALALLAATVGLSLALPGCVCCAAGEYAPQCLDACGQLCTEACVPICIDTIRGNGPFSAAAQLSKDARQAPEAPPPVTTAEQPANGLAY